MKTKIVFASLLVLAFAASVAAQTFNFDQDEVGKTPQGFSSALTGKGKIGNWVVMKEGTAPSQPNVLAQTDRDATGYRFPVCVFDSVMLKDADISVKFKPVKGEGDQAAGIVWRYQDKDNYYICARMRWRIMWYSTKSRKAGAPISRS